MDDATDRHRDRILAELAELRGEDDATADARRPVVLDQQSVGRLSRMDALQDQAMAQGQSRRREARERALRATLTRMDEGEFGHCTECGEAVAPRRLDLDPAVALCIGCARG